MNLEELKKTAFAKWLRAQEPQDQVEHIFECLKRHNSTENMAWELMHIVHDDHFIISEKTIIEALIKLETIMAPCTQKSECKPETEEQK